MNNLDLCFSDERNDSCLDADTPLSDTSVSACHVLIVSGPEDASSRFQRAFPSQIDKCRVAKLIERGESIATMPEGVTCKLSSFNMLMESSPGQMAYLLHRFAQTGNACEQQPNKVQGCFNVSEYGYIDYQDPSVVEELSSQLKPPSVGERTPPLVPVLKFPIMTDAYFHSPPRMRRSTQTISPMSPAPLHLDDQPGRPARLAASSSQSTPDRPLLSYFKITHRGVRSAGNSPFKPYARPVPHNPSAAHALTQSVRSLVLE